MTDEQALALPSPASRETSRLFVIGGIWDLVVWKAYFASLDEPCRGDLVVFSKAFSGEDLKLIGRLGGACGFDLISYRDENSLKETISKVHYEQLFISHLSDAFSSFVLHNHPSAVTTVLFEGLAAYVPPAAIQGFIRAIDRYIFFGKTLPVPEFIPEKKVRYVESDSMRESIAFFSAELGISDREYDYLEKAEVLVVGQHFYRHRLIDWHEELSIYAEGIAKARSADDIILWKEHPRSQQPFFPKLELEFENLRELGSDKLIPIELYANRFRQEIKILGICSNTLFNLKDFFGFATLTLLNESTMTKFSYGRVERMALINFWGYAYLNPEVQFTPATVSSALGYGQTSVEAKIKQDSEKKQKVAKKKKRPHWFLRFLRRNFNKVISHLGMEIVYK